MADRTGCKHSRAEYVAEYVLNIMFRDYLKCPECGSEYCYATNKWGASSAQERSR